MPIATVFCAFTLTLVGVILLYLTMSLQQWLSKPLSAQPYRMCTYILWCVSGDLFFTTDMALAPAIFCQMVLTMLLLGGLPFLNFVIQGKAQIAKPAGKKKDHSRELNPVQAQWWSKSILGLLLTLMLAIGMSGVFAWWGPGGIDAHNKVQFNMWIIPLLWMLLFSFSYWFRNVLRLTLCLGMLNILVYSLLFIARNGI